MQLVGRNYYHPDRKIDVKAHKMQVWPGFSTSILQYEKDVMLCADVAHKVLRMQTVLEFLYEIYNSSDQHRFYDIAKKKLLGEIILTRYVTHMFLLISKFAICKAVFLLDNFNPLHYITV